VDAEQLARKSSAQNKPGQSQSGTGSSQAGDPGDDQGTASADDKNSEKSRQEEIRRRRRLNLIVSDNRNVREKEETTNDDPLVQNRNITVDLQPVFMITAFEKNSVNYERLQYYNADIELLNKQNNYYPLLTITNKTNEGYLSLFQNYILYFNEKIKIAGNSYNYLNRGIFYTMTGDYIQSLRDLDNSIRQDSSNALAWLSRANCRLRMAEHFDQLSGAPDQWSISRKDNRDQASPETSQFEITGDYELILDDYNKTLSLLPGFFFGYFNRAYIYLRMKKFELAMADLDKAIDQEPEFAEAYYNRGLAKIFLDDPKAGAIDLSKAGELGLVEAYSIIKRYCN
jgi:tetratricopeptide (TPR) repeat protein